MLYESFLFQQPTLKDFETLLRAHPSVFHPAKTARCLASYWQSLKQYTLLPDQAVQPMPKDNHILNFLDAESNINDGELFDEKDDMMDHELSASDRKYAKQKPF
jgi:microspherule protein 1